MNSELEKKTERLRRVIRDEDLGGILLNSQHNFAWLTGGRSNGIDFSRDNGACYLLVTKAGKRYLIANNIEMPRLLAEEISADDFEAVEVSWQSEKQGDTILKTANSLLSGGRLATDSTLFAETSSVEPLIAACRYELTLPEIERYRSLGRDAGEALGKTISKITPGMSEIEIAAAMRTDLSAYGLFATVVLVAADERIAKYRHPVPTDNIWKNTLLLVACTRRHGLIVSLSRMMCVGDIPEDLEHRTEATA